MRTLGEALEWVLAAVTQLERGVGGGGGVCFEMLTLTQVKIEMRNEVWMIEGLVWYARWARMFYSYGNQDSIFSKCHL